MDTHEEGVKVKEAFVAKTFQAGSEEVIEQAVAICEAYAAQGYDLSLRQLYYQFVSRQPLSYEWANTEQNYKRLGSIISDARLAGRLDWDFIKDRGRVTVQNSHWESPAEILKACAKQFTIDLWEGQPNHVEVMVEKQALEGVLQPVCKRLDVAFTANKGYSSSSSMYSIADRMRNSEGVLHVIYLGDHDPSGVDMTRDVEERLELFTGCDVFVHRVALNMDQVEEHNPPENPTKLTDSRANGYIDRYGYSCWELDALEPRLLAKLVSDMVISLRDDDLWDKQIAKRNQWRREIKEIAAKYETPEVQ
jgi:hypothetical protein